MVLAIPEVDARAPHRVVTVRLTLLSLRLQQVDGKEVPPQVKMGADTQVSLAQRDKSGQMLNPIGIQMLQHDLIVIEKSVEKPVGGAVRPRSWNGTNETT
jgi:hypothetical protein